MTRVADRDLDELLGALDAELQRLGAGPIEICVIGGTALNAIGLVIRPTKDVDVVAIGSRDRGALVLAKSRPIPPALADAARAVSVQFGIDPGWLNSGPADLVDHGLPQGFEERLTAKAYGGQLTVQYAGRLDQVCFKTFAAADSAGRHLTDLIALTPTESEIRFAVRWIAEQDTLEGFRSQLVGLLDYLGMPDAIDEV